jgi:hypothetical protein
LSTLGITKELVQGIVIALSGVVGSVLADIVCVADWIVNRPIRLLLRSVIAIMSGLVRIPVV